MNKIEWFPEYWSLIEKTKLFDFWRSRYCKNKLYFSPNKENCGGIGFYDASYESLKFDNDKYRYKKVENEFIKRKEMLLNELKNSQEQDKKRLILLLEAEEKAFDYWKAKIILKPIEDDIPHILKQSIWLIDEKERVFKESFSYLIEYDRQNLSPLTYPERKLNEHALTITESYYWLIREERKLGKDSQFFDKHEEEIGEISRFDLLNTTYQPDVLLNRHNDNVKREERKGLKRSKNGDLLQKNEEGKFERPITFYSNELKEENIEVQIEKFKDMDIDKYETNYENDIHIFKTDELNVEQKLQSIFEHKGKNIPKNPYILLQKNLFTMLQEDELQENVIQELKKFIKNKQKEIKQEKTKTSRSIFYFFFNKDNKLENKELAPDEKVKIEKKVLEKDGVIFLSTKETDDSLEETKRTYWDYPEDEFDDKTRFRFFIKDKFGYRFDRKGLMNKLSQNFSHKLQNAKQSLKEKLLALKNKIVQDDKKVKLGIEKPVDLMANKVANLEFKEQLNQLKENRELKQRLENNLRPEFKPR